MDKWLDNYKVMTAMNNIMYQAVYKSTIVLINSIFQIGMRAVDQKLKWCGLISFLASPVHDCVSVMSQAMNIYIISEP